MPATIPTLRLAEFDAPARPAIGLLGTEPGDWWLPVPETLTVSHDEVHVWRASLDVAPWHRQQLLSTLASDEVAKAERFYHAQDRVRFIVARGLLRVILGRYLGVSPRRLQFRYGPWGKPALAPEFGVDDLQFNLSHAHDLALYAIARNRQVGIDLEYLRSIPEVEQLVERYFSSHEKTAFHALAPCEQLGAFFRCWTCKEAFIKARGQGFSLAPDRFDVSIAPGMPATLLGVCGNGGEASRWSLRELAPAFGYLAALAAEGNGWRLLCWEWTE
jgi:4'-phosphopantetheinyl transferase